MRFLLIFLSHDIDWPRNGPPKQHIFDRKDRFDPETLDRVISGDFNPYFGVRSLMEMEKQIGVRSTFFFRPTYDDSSSAREYAQDIRDLEAGGWEIGVHLNDASTKDDVSRQKRIIDGLVEKPTCGTRVHYLRVNYDKIPELGSSGFLYDSSLVYSKETYDERNAGVLKIGSLTEFPITFMDAYLFSYWKIPEYSVVDFVISKIKDLKRKGFPLATILWHDNALLMRGGRRYKELIEAIHAIDGLEVRRGADLLSELRQ
jgi:peptidoglycan/xylan/chitin deacetylase (PgdA/CDA1 family)